MLLSQLRTNITEQQVNVDFPTASFANKLAFSSYLAEFWPCFRTAPRWPGCQTWTGQTAAPWTESLQRPSPSSACHAPSVERHGGRCVKYTMHHSSYQNPQCHLGVSQLDVQMMSVKTHWCRFRQRAHFYQWFNIIMCCFHYCTSRECLLFCETSSF